MVNMKASLKELTQELPDFNDLFELGDKISNFYLKKLTLEREIKAREAAVIKIVSTMQEYWANGKPLAMSYIESTFKYTGLDGELLPLRDQYNEVSAELERLKTRLSLYNSYLDVWRTLSATERFVNS
jgi:hypothetical protein